jgi:hypothetical protein
MNYVVFFYGNVLQIKKMAVSLQHEKSYLSVAMHETCGVNLKDIFLSCRLNGCD